MPDRPVVHCWIALIKGDGPNAYARPRIVKLSTALVAKESGRYIVIGPDPEDEEKLATWEREQSQINKPRWQQ